jgi:regulator of protease activity HflC (stomatin/prohibitin superfamily)
VVSTTAQRPSVESAMKKNIVFYRAVRVSLILLLGIIIFTPFSLVNAGERGVLMQFGKVQEKILGEGIHPVVPLINTVKKLSVRVQKQEISKPISFFNKLAMRTRLLSGLSTQQLKKC